MTPRFGLFVACLVGCVVSVGCGGGGGGGEAPAGCTTGADCPLGQVCVGRTCVPSGCTSDADCPDGTCVEGRCQPAGACDCLPTSACTATDPACGSGGCSSDDQCQDDDPCTADTCADGVCAHTPRETCCSDDQGCDDASPCTVDYCLDGECHNDWLGGAGCCADDAACDDGDPCTTDRCEAGQCRHEPSGAGDCCDADGDCDDADPCTADTCVGGACLHDDTDRCCALPEDCDDGNPCTLDTCPDGFCAHEPTGDPNCCTSDADCDDGDPCSADSCAPSGVCRHAYQAGPGCCQEDGDCEDDLDCTTEFCCLSAECCQGGSCVTAKHCVYLVAPGGDCCVADSACDDGVRCTDDHCINGQCVHAPAPDCCASDADCLDGNPCTREMCSGGICLWQSTADCCASAADCDDLDGCTSDDCTENVCTHETLPGCCASDADCDDGNPCFAGRCVAGSCTSEPVFPCCTVDGDCDRGDPCEDAACQGGNCVYTPVSDCCMNDGDCEDYDPCTTDRCDASRCRHTPYTGPECCEPRLHLEADFDTGTPSPFTLQSAGGTVQWQVTALGRAHSAPYALYYGQTTNWTYENGLQHLGLATSAPIALPVDDVLLLGFWVYLDIDPTPTQDRFEARVLAGGVPTVVFTKDEFGGNTAGAFRFVRVDLAAWAGQTVQIQFAFDAVNTQVHAGEGVFLDDVFVASGCERLPVECTLPADCADSDPCTDEDCVLNACVRFDLAGPLCCGPHVLEATFDDGTLQGFAVEPLADRSTRIAWNVTPRRFRSDAAAAYFGDPTTGNYADGTTATGGVLVSPEFTVPTGASLSFWLWLQVEPVGSYDSLLVQAEPAGGAPVRLWSTLDAFLYDTGGAFTPIAVPLAAVAGQTVRLRFVFDTSNGFGNGYEGAYVDDIAVGGPCP